MCMYARTYTRTYLFDIVIIDIQSMLEHYSILEFLFGLVWFGLVYLFIHSFIYLFRVKWVQQ